LAIVVVDALVKIELREVCLAVTIPTIGLEGGVHERDVLAAVSKTTSSDRGEKARAQDNSERDNDVELHIVVMQS